MIITPLSAPAPTESDPDNFDARATQLFAEELPRFIDETALLEARLTASAAPGGLMIPYVFDSATSVADPGARTIRFNHATQASATVLCADLVDAIAQAATDRLDSLNVGTSVIKYQIRVQKAGDPTKFLMFDLLGVTDPGGGYRQLIVANGYPAGASPFAATDNLVLTATKVGDRGAFPAYDLLATTPISSPAGLITFSSITDAYSDLFASLDGVTASAAATFYFSLYDGTSWTAPQQMYVAATAVSVSLGLEIPRYQTGFGVAKVTVRYGAILGASPTVITGDPPSAGNSLEYLWRITPAITGIRFSLSSGNFTGGVARLFGH